MPEECQFALGFGDAPQYVLSTIKAGLTKLKRNYKESGKYSVV